MQKVLRYETPDWERSCGHYRSHKSAIKRATICNSDPLCWKSDGQGLFDLNFGTPSLNTGKLVGSLIRARSTVFICIVLLLFPYMVFFFSWLSIVLISLSKWEPTD